MVGLSRQNRSTTVTPNTGQPRLGVTEIHGKIASEIWAMAASESLTRTDKGVQDDLDPMDQHRVE
jgi:hypothetical protein